MGLVFSQCVLNGFKSAKQPSSSSPVEQLCHKFSLAEIKSATANIREDLRNIFYKGYLNNGNREVTVKKINYYYSVVDLSACKNEVLLLCQLRHPNLLSLIGFCETDNEFFCVYEPTRNGSLHNLLHFDSETKGKIDALPWKTRLQICIGVARGLHYLHTGVKYAIVYRNMSSNHILFDENWVPKIAELNLARRGPLSVSRKLFRVDSRVMGVYGYAAPEYMATGDLTEKVDVFSFGILLLEVLSAKEPFYCFNERNHLVEATSDDEIVDPFLKSKIAPECYQVFIDVTGRCLLEEGMERPHMGEVEVELEHALRLQEEADGKIECSSSGRQSG